MPDKTLILAKISKILIAAEQGKMHKYNGKSLDEISEKIISSEDEVSGGSDSEESISSLHSSELRKKAVLYR